MFICKNVILAAVVGGKGEWYWAHPLKDMKSGHYAPRRKKNLNNEISLMKLEIEITQQQLSAVLCRILRP